MSAEKTRGRHPQQENEANLLGGQWKKPAFWGGVHLQCEGKARSGFLSVPVRFSAFCILHITQGAAQESRPSSSF